MKVDVLRATPAFQPKSYLLGLFETVTAQTIAEGLAKGLYEPAATFEVDVADDLDVLGSVAVSTYGDTCVATGDVVILGNAGSAQRRYAISHDGFVPLH